MANRKQDKISNNEHQEIEYQESEHQAVGSRRTFLKHGLGLALFAGAGYGAASFFVTGNASDGKKQKFEITKTDAEWKKILTPEQYYILRKHGTERRNTSPLLHEKRAGTYHCAGCDLPVYESSTKYDSGTGWPSYFKAIDGSVGTQLDKSLFTVRTEVHCRRCGGHFGHIFDDGPKPTGKRHCINGDALVFKPA